MEKDYLILKRTSVSRPSGAWKDDDYDVLADGTVVGRIFKAGAVGMLWKLDIGLPAPGRIARQVIIFSFTARPGANAPYFRMQSPTTPVGVPHLTPAGP
jgi:hypothetical protein